MATATAVTRPAERKVRPGNRRSATRVAVAVLGTLVGLAGIEHGIGEILQGPVRPEGLFIMSWPDAPALQILSGEPAMTVIPDLLVTGILAVVVGLAVAAWSIWFIARRHGGMALIGLSVLLLLIGGGVAPPLMGVTLGLVATRIGAAHPPRPGRLGRTIGPAWPWFLAAAVLGYLGLMPVMAPAAAVPDRSMTLRRSIISAKRSTKGIPTVRWKRRTQSESSCIGTRTVTSK